MLKKNVFINFLIFFAIQIAYTYYLIKIDTVSIFGTNDDALMALLVKNSITGQEDPRIIFIKPLLSSLMTTLQPFFPTTFIYTFILFAIVIISISLVYSILFLESKSFISKSLIVLIFLIQTTTFLKWFYINPTYTGASIISSFCFVALMILINRLNSKIGFNNIFALIFCISCTYLIREESLFILVWFIIPILFLNKKNLLLNIRILIKCLFALILFIIINIIFENHYYSISNWQKYLELNSARHKIQLRSIERNLEQKYLQVNWTRSDYILFTKFLLADKSKFNIIKLKQIISNENFNQNLMTITNIKVNFQKIIKDFFPWTWLLQALIFLLLLNIIMSRLYDFKFIIINLTIFMIFISFFLYILKIFYQIPERISFNLLFGFFILVMCISSPIYKLKKNLFSVSIILLALYLSSNIYNRSVVENIARQNYYLTMYKYFQNQVDFLNFQKSTIIVNTSNFKIDWQNPYISNTEFTSVYSKVVLLSWLNLSPTWDFVVRNKNLDPNDFWESSINSEALLFSDPYSQLIIENYLLSKNLNNIKFLIIDKFKFDDLNIYKLTYR